MVRIADRTSAKFKKVNVEPGVVYADGYEEFEPIVDEAVGPHPFSFLFDSHR